MIYFPARSHPEVSLTEPKRSWRQWRLTTGVAGEPAPVTGDQEPPTVESNRQVRPPFLDTYCRVCPEPLPLAEVSMNPTR